MPPRHARSACARRGPTSFCSALSRLPRWRRLPRLARCSPARCWSSRPRPLGCGRTAFARGSWPASLLAAAEGVFGPWLSVEFNAPPGADDRRACRRGVRARAARAIGRAAARCGSGRRRRRARPGCSPAAASGRGLEARSWSRRRRRSRDFVRAVGGEAIDGPPDPAPNTDPHEYEPRPDDVQAIAARQGRVRERRRARRVDAQGRRRRGWQGRGVVNLGDVARTQVPGERRSAGVGVDPHWWHDPRNARQRSSGSASRSTRAFPRTRSRSIDAPLHTVERIDALDTAHRGAASRRCRASQRKLVTEPRRVRLLREALRDRGGRRDRSRLSRPRRSRPPATSRGWSRRCKREHVRAIFFERSVNPKLGEAVGDADGRDRRTCELYGDTLGPKDRRARRTSGWSSRTPTRWCAGSPAGSGDAA